MHVHRDDTSMIDPPRRTHRICRWCAGDHWRLAVLAAGAMRDYRIGAERPPSGGGR
jgi:hypothetical protein